MLMTSTQKAKCVGFPENKYFPGQRKMFGKLDYLKVKMIIFPLLCRIFLHLHGNDTVTSV